MADDEAPDAAPEFVPPDLPHAPPPHEDSLLQREKNLAGTAGLTLEGLHERIARLEARFDGQQDTPPPPAPIGDEPSPGFEADGEHGDQSNADAPSAS